MMQPNHALQRTGVIALRLQSMPLAGRVAELESLGFVRKLEEKCGAEIF